jgi:hypothetical protein
MLFLLFLIVRFLTRPLVSRRGDASSKDLVQRPINSLTGGNQAIECGRVGCAGVG